MLSGDRRVPVLPTPPRNAPEAPAQLVTRRRAFDDSRPPQGTWPEVREAEHVEALGSGGRTPDDSASGPRGTPECDEASLLSMQSQPVPGKPLRQYRPHPPRVFLSGRHRPQSSSGGESHPSSYGGLARPGARLMSGALPPAVGDGRLGGNRNEQRRPRLSWGIAVMGRGGIDLSGGCLDRKQQVVHDLPRSRDEEAASGAIGCSPREVSTVVPMRVLRELREAVEDDISRPAPPAAHVPRCAGVIWALDTRWTADDLAGPGRPCFAVCSLSIA